MIKIKPLTTNRAWKGGRRFNTDEYKAYTQELYYLLKNREIPKGKLELNVTFFVSNKLSDLDNFLKPFIDILQKRYNFNDRDIYKITTNKVMVAKGEEGIDFNLTEYRPNG